VTNLEEQLVAPLRGLAGRTIDEASIVEGSSRLDRSPTRS
jgi:hypothetical protein